MRGTSLCFLAACVRWCRFIACFRFCHLCTNFFSPSLESFDFFACMMGSSTRPYLFPPSSSWHAAAKTNNNTDFPDSLKNFIKTCCDEVLKKDAGTAKISRKLSKTLAFEDCKCLMMEMAFERLSVYLEEDGNRDGVFFENAFELLRRIPAPVQKRRKFSCSYIGASNRIKGRMKFNRMVRLYSELWNAMTKFALGSTKTHKRMLSWIPEHVLQHVENPVLFSDFFFRSFQLGDPFNILALSGLFTLIHEHNLEYPDFYNQVYNLIQPDVCYAVQYRKQLFKLLNLFLSSTHLPCYLVAAFCKKLSRLLLTAPEDTCLVLLDLISNLIVRHPALKPLLHSNSQVCEDPFNINEKDVSNANGLESSLWEVKSLESHWFPDVARKAAFLLKEMPKIENNVTWFDSELIWDREISRKDRKRETTLAFVQPKGLFGSQTIDVDSCFSV